MALNTFKVISEEVIEEAPPVVETAVTGQKPELPPSADPLQPPTIQNELPQNKFKVISEEGVPVTEEALNIAEAEARPGFREGIGMASRGAASEIRVWVVL